MSADPTSTIKLLTVAEVADLLKISASGVRRLQQTRHLPFIKVGGSVRFSRDDILSYLEKRRVEVVDAK
jgi:excisionase family DNA binding protein